MIEIISLVLGLVTGLQPIELSVVGPVATVEIQLDGKTLGKLNGPPWTFACNFGERLLPHRLVVIAQDAQGRELDRAERLVNVESETADAELALLSDPQGKPVALSISWESIGQIQPQSLEVAFDDRPLQVTDPKYIPLPPYDLKDFHFATATLTFQNDITSHLQAGFGGVLGDEVATELTAVTVLSEKKRLPSEKKMEGWFRAAGKDLKVHGTEKGTAELFVVRDPSIQPQIDSLAWYLYERTTPAQRRGGRSEADLAALVNADQRWHARLTKKRQSVGRLREFALLNPGDTMRFVAPASAPLLPNGVQKDLFLQSPNISATQVGLGRLMLGHTPQKFDVRLADAVALAGMLANSSQKRRAVLLLLGEGGTDTSMYRPANVRNYLRALGIPLFVARFNGEQPDLDWGEVLHLGNLEKPAEAERQFRQAFQQVHRHLEQQRLVWLLGRHLPQQIELGSAAQGIQLTGR